VVDDGGGAAFVALDASLPRAISGVGVAVAEGHNEVVEARGAVPGAASVHDDAVEQGAVVEHLGIDRVDRLGDLGDLELGVVAESALKEIKKEKKKRGGEQRERFQDGEKRKGKKRRGGEVAHIIDVF